MTSCDSVLLLSGGRGRGKSTVLERVFQEAAAAGIVLAGVLSRRVPSGIHAVLLPDQTEFPLALYTINSPAGEITLGPYRFSRDAVTRVNAHLCGVPANTDAAIVDEIGPLELKRSGGFLPGLNHLLTLPIPLVVVIRPELLTDLTQLIERAGRRVAHKIADPRPSKEAVRIICDYITSSEMFSRNDDL